jgi:oligopeptide/dipeptide ABC transporter ATP-binding protein
MLQIKNLSTYFYTDDGVVKAVEGVNFPFMKGDVLGIVGESGCGKSTLAMSIPRLISSPGKIVSGQILYNAQDIMKMTSRRLCALRGSEIAMIFQNPFTCLNPVITIGDQISEAVRAHNKVSRKKAREEVMALLSKVQIPDPKLQIKKYPHELSGGMRQRVMIAIALAGRPKILIADEPTTALDVTIQAQLIYLLRDLQKEYGLSIIFITHDLAVMSNLCRKVAVMYAGRIIEWAESIEQFYDNPLHPYSRGLLDSVPRQTLGQKKLTSIPGNPPDLAHLQNECAFAPRCKFVREECLQRVPELFNPEKGRFVRCVLWKK